MPLTDQSKLSIVLKKILGKAQTDNAKEGANEAKFDSITTTAATTIALPIPADPTNTSLYDITTASGVPCVELLRLELVADPSSNGHAFFAQLPAAYTTNSTNPKKGTAPFTNQSVLVDTAGKLQTIPPLYGLKYEAKPYIGGTSAKGSGTLVPPGDERDWYYDYFNGVFFQQDNVGGTVSYIECFVYVGPLLEESLEFATLKQNDSGVSLTAGQIVYVNSSGNIMLAQATVADINKYPIGIVLQSSIAPATSGYVLLKEGVPYLNYTGMGVGPLYLSRLTPVATTQDMDEFLTGDFLYQVGIAIVSNKLMFDPVPIIQL
jgi:hypothetical protein